MAERVIYKYKLTPLTYGVVMPQGAELLHVAAQDENPCVWALVDPERPEVLRRIEPWPTGSSPPGKYVGTVHMIGGSLVLHLFDLGEAPHAQ